MDTIDFSNDSQSSQEKPDAVDKLAEAAGLKNKDDESTPANTSKESGVDEIDLDDSAIVLFEDNEHIFTSEGIVSKKSQSLNKQENSSDAEPSKDKDGKILGKFDSYDDLAKSYKELQKKLGTQSKAVEKLRELQPVLPMLEAMMSDETFLGLAEDYFTDPEKQSQALKQQLGIGDDFVFDLNNALADPKSEDAKVLNKIMKARQPKKQPKSQTENNQHNESAKKSLMEKYDLDEDGFNEMMAKARDYTISYEDIYFLLNKEKILSEREKKGQEAVKEQLKSANRYRKSPSPKSTPKPEASPADSFMKSLMGEEGLFAE